MACALRQKEDPSLESTIEFIEYLNDAFDIMNIKSVREGVRHRNKFKEKLSSATDWRFQVCPDLNLIVSIFAD